MNLWSPPLTPAQEGKFSGPPKQGELEEFVLHSLKINAAIGHSRLAALARRYSFLTEKIVGLCISSRRLDGAEAAVDGGISALTHRLFALVGPRPVGAERSSLELRLAELELMGALLETTGKYFDLRREETFSKLIAAHKDMPQKRVSPDVKVRHAGSCLALSEVSGAPPDTLLLNLAAGSLALEGNRYFYHDEEDRRSTVLADLTVALQRTSASLDPDALRQLHAMNLENEARRKHPTGIYRLACSKIISLIPSPRLKGLEPPDVAKKTL